MKISLLPFLLLVLFSQILLSKQEESITLKSVYPLSSKNFEFDQISDIIIKQGNVISINKSLKPNLKDSLFAIPGFCDAKIQLSSNSKNGFHDLDGVLLSLKSFLAHGFVNVLSIGDPHWIYEIEADIKRGKYQGPNIQISKPPILLASSITSNVQDSTSYSIIHNELELTNTLNNFKSTNSPIHLYHYFSTSKDQFFKIEPIYRINKFAVESNLNLISHTFANPNSILDSLYSGIRILYHPIPIEISSLMDKYPLEDLTFVPILNNYYFQTAQNDEALMNSVIDFMKTNSLFFTENYLSGMEIRKSETILSEKDKNKVLKEYNSYKKFLQNHPILNDKLILASGSGQFHSYPGIAGWVEMKIIYEITKDLKNLLKIATRNTCRFIGGEYDGTIDVNKPANLILLEKNPLEEFNNLFTIKSVIVDGKLIYTKKLEKK